MTQATQPRPRPLRRRDVPAIDKRELVSSDDFAFAIKQRWQDSVAAIIDVGKLLLGANLHFSPLSPRLGKVSLDLPPGTSPLSKLDLGPFEVHSMV